MGTQSYSYLVKVISTAIEGSVFCATKESASNVADCLRKVKNALEFEGPLTRDNGAEELRVLLVPLLDELAFSPEAPARLLAMPYEKRTKLAELLVGLLIRCTETAYSEP